MLALVRAGSVFNPPFRSAINTMPFPNRVKLGPVIEPEAETRAKAAKAYEHVIDALREIAFMWRQDEF